MAWFDNYERDVLGQPGAPWPTRPRSLPVDENDPVEPVAWDIHIEPNPPSWASWLRTEFGHMLDALRVWRWL
ncbi:hypothetical protein ACQPW1_00365 [Nocardia sp. CA-128927]|uniref:hypothetical protein n=1 Tax=Nocardia sp. CA-128927 TaxID=3239975 RepID=UPI003D958167